MSSDTELWTFRHEPRSLKNMALDPDVRKKLKKVIREVPNIILHGKPGTGKGTFTHILLKETGYDKLWVNASDETGIDVIRDKVKSFATSMGITPIKIIIMNEADSLTSGPQGSQKALRQLMEDVHKVTRFIFLANYVQNIIPELKSRCSVIEMKPAPGKEILTLCEKVLKSERVKYNKSTVVNIIKKSYPDIRKTIFALQENTEEGQLISDVVDKSEVVYESVLKSILVKDPEHVRNVLKSNVIDYIGLYEYLFENVGKFTSPADAILEIGEHSYRDNVVAIKEINFIHMVVSMLKKGII